MYEWFLALDLIGKIIFIVAGLVGVWAVYMFICAMLWRKVGPNEVLIISGWRKEIFEDPVTGERRRVSYKIVRGGGSVVIPVLERADIMSLELITIDEAGSEFRTKQGVPILVEGVAQIKVKGDEASIRTAAEQFLSKSIEQVKEIAHQTVMGHLRAILSTMTVEEVYTDYEAFAQKVQEVSGQDLARMGLQAVSFTIRSINDTQGYLEALGKPRIASVKRDAAIAEAEMFRDAAIKSANAKQESETAKFIADTKIAEAERDFEVKQQEYATSVNHQKAEADLAYDLHRYKVAQQVKQEEVQVTIIEKQKMVELQAQEIKRKELELDALVYKPALAEKQRIEALASAEQFRLKATAEGQSEAIKLSGAAEADANRLRGLAQADIVKAQGLAEADMIRAKGLAEADSVKAKGLAEAEAMDRQAAAFKQYNEAAVAHMLVEKLPAIAEAVASPLSKVDKIVLIGGGVDGAGAGKITSEVTSIMAQVPPVIEAMTGLNIGDLVRRSPKIDGSAAKPVAPREERPKPPVVTPQAPPTENN